MTFDYDLFVLGAGSGGVRASRVAASLGARVGVIEEKALGGTCVNVGCVPKKLMVMGAHFAEEWQDAAGFGWSVTPPTHAWSTLIANKDREIARLNGVYGRLLEQRGVRVHRGRGVLRGPHEVELRLADGSITQVTAQHILLAVGGRPVRPAFPGAEHVMISDDVFHLPELPRRMLVIGGGYIAVELAGVFAGYGAQVTLLYRGDLFLRGFDHDVRTHLAQELRKKHIDLRFGRDVARLDRQPDGSLRATLDDGSTLDADGALAAIGRTPNTAGLGLEEVGVKLDRRGAIRVDARLRTSVPSIWAVGDVIDRVALTPVALAEGMLVAQQLFGAEPRAVDYDLIPSAVFSNPPIGTVGLSEEEARATVGAVDVFRTTFTPMKHTMTGRDERTLMKIVVDRATDRVLGLHVVGPEAGEIIQGFAVALRCGATKAQLDSTLGIHPTLAEELVTMRERCPDPDHELHVDHVNARPKRIVSEQWGEG